MNIRALRAEDYVAWLRLWQGYQQFYQTEIDEATAGETFRRMLSRAEPMYCLVLEQGGSMVGLVHFLTHRSTWTRGDTVICRTCLSQKRRAVTVRVKR